MKYVIGLLSFSSSAIRLQNAGLTFSAFFSPSIKKSGRFVKCAQEICRILIATFDTSAYTGNRMEVLMKGGRYAGTC